MSLERLKGKLVSVAFKKEIQWQEDRSGKRLIFPQGKIIHHSPGKKGLGSVQAKQPGAEGTERESRQASEQRWALKDEQGPAVEWDGEFQAKEMALWKPEFPEQLHPSGFLGSRVEDEQQERLAQRKAQRCTDFSRGASCIHSLIQSTNLSWAPTMCQPLRLNR